MKIMFVCTGNICRSAMAEYLAKKIAKQQGKDIHFFSCGIYADEKDGPTQNAIEVMEEYNIDIKKHKPTNIKNANIKEMDIILCMTKEHKMQLTYLYPDMLNKIFTLKEYAENRNEDIKDPWGYDIYTYRKCAEEINQELNKLITNLK